MGAGTLDFQGINSLCMISSGINKANNNNMFIIVSAVDSYLTVIASDPFYSEYVGNGFICVIWFMPVCTCVCMFHQSLLYVCGHYILRVKMVIFFSEDSDLYPT